MNSKALSLAFACMFLASCSGQFVKKQTLDKVGLSVIIAAGKVEIASNDEAKSMRDLGEVVGHSCQNKVGVDEAESTKVGALDQLRIAAALKGATAISDPNCKQGGFSLLKNCWNSWECRASALK